MRRFLALIAASLFLLGWQSAKAYQGYLNTVNDACGETVITDCSTCHGDGSGSCSTDTAACTPEQIAYQSGEYCYFCPTSTTCGGFVEQDNEEIMAAEAREAVGEFHNGVEMLCLPTIQPRQGKEHFLLKLNPFFFRENQVHSEVGGSFRDK